jgi:uncharacterized protein YbaR (Trm112 family)
MLIVLTDVLACPRCGPEFGLLVMAERLENRRVLEGSLGCPNCRELFAIHAGVADLRYRAAAAPSVDQPFLAADRGIREDGEAALRIAALLGVTSGPGVLVLAGPDAALAGEVAALVPEIGTAGVGPEVLPLPDHEGGSRILAERALPFRSGSARGVALSGWAASRLLEEGARVVVGGGRLVLDPAPADAVRRLHDVGFTVLLEQEGIVVATGSGAG